jgi:hypothetical protein
LAVSRKSPTGGETNLARGEVQVGVECKAVHAKLFSSWP